MEHKYMINFEIFFFSEKKEHITEIGNKNFEKWKISKFS